MVKFFKTGKGDATSAEQYLTSHGEVVRGDIKLTTKIANSIEREWKYTSGVLSFEEDNLSIKQKQKIMQDFEKVLFPKMQEDQYNISWVEHHDKNRLELHFLSPRSELKSGKEFTHYLDSRDRKKINLFRDITNAELKLSSPMEFSKRKVIPDHKPKFETPKEMTKKAINEAVQKNVYNGLLENRNQIIEFLQDAGAKINRKGKNYLGIQIGDKKIRLKGAIYSDNFTTTRELEKIRKSDEKEHITEIKNDIQRARARLEKILQTTGEKIQAKYQVHSHNNSDNLKHSDKYPNLSNNGKMGSSKESEIPRQTGEIHHSTEKKHIRDYETELQSSKNKIKKERDERIRNEIIKLSRERERRKIEREERASQLSIANSRTEQPNHRATTTTWREERENRHHRRNFAEFLGRFKERIFSTIAAALKTAVETIKKAEKKEPILALESQNKEKTTITTPKPFSSTQSEATEEIDQNDWANLIKEAHAKANTTEKLN